MAEIVETAVTNFKLKDAGYDTGYEFQKRLVELHQNSRREGNLKEGGVTQRSPEAPLNEADEPYPKMETGAYGINEDSHD
jgi:hypothetical protein